MPPKRRLDLAAPLDLTPTNSLLGETRPLRKGPKKPIQISKVTSVHVHEGRNPTIPGFGGPGLVRNRTATGLNGFLLRPPKQQDAQNVHETQANNEAKSERSSGNDIKEEAEEAQLSNKQAQREAKDSKSKQVQRKPEGSKSKDNNKEVQREQVQRDANKTSERGADKTSLSFFDVPRVNSTLGQKTEGNGNCGPRALVKTHIVVGGDSPFSSEDEAITFLRHASAKYLRTMHDSTSVKEVEVLGAWYNEKAAEYPGKSVCEVADKWGRLRAWVDQGHFLVMASAIGLLSMPYHYVQAAGVLHVEALLPAPAVLKVPNAALRYLRGMRTALLYNGSVHFSAHVSELAFATWAPSLVRKDRVLPAKLLVPQLTGVRGAAYLSLYK
ncbi:hypothetical protein Rhopal_006242-T1 [Rhodotorula paludigena]|uniref:Uncharacterized protein n=1 Tax=Rhodotorula paludigena TaxID=86838 RepID=A0AAV5GUL3_9BASI|nr:hypothetical protein Rhopal_006242-T1 [Rhodotorula paludigena]